MVKKSAKMLVCLAPENVAMFRFLLEARENLANFSVLDRKKALLKLNYSPDSEKSVIEFLKEASTAFPLSYQTWPIK